jgi:hypothetical protein
MDHYLRFGLRPSRSLAALVNISPSGEPPNGGLLIEKNLLGFIT